MAARQWFRTSVAVRGTRRTTADVLHGHRMWMALRVFQTSSVFLVVGSLFGAFHSWEALACLPFALLLGMAVALPMTAYSATTESESGFAAIQRFVVIPLFLFSGTFFPLSQLPAPL